MYKLLFKMARSVLVAEVCVMSTMPYQPTHLTFPARSFGETVICLVPSKYPGLITFHGSTMM